MSEINKILITPPFGARTFAILLSYDRSSESINCPLKLI